MSKYPKVVLKEKPLLDRMNNYRFQFQERFGRMPTEKEQNEAFKHIKKDCKE